MNALETYLEEPYAIRSSGGAVKETSYYPALSNLLNEVGKTLKPRVRCIINIQNAGAGLPDGGLYAAEQFQKQSKAELREGQLPARGAIEVKSTGEEVKNIAGSEQVLRYVNRYKQVLVTNYRDFVLVGVDHEGKVTNRESQCGIVQVNVLKSFQPERRQSLETARRAAHPYRRRLGSWRGVAVHVPLRHSGFH